MNRILFEKGEISRGVATFGGVRAEHVLKVLHGEVGQLLKTGEVDGPIGTGEITAIEDGLVTVRLKHDAEALAPWVDLILAPPRPRVMKRLLPQLASLGVGRIVLVGAKKVEKDFWGATLLKEEIYRPLLIDGLMQAGTTALPTISTVRSFRKWLREDLDREFSTSRRIVAHPYGADCRPERAEKSGRLLLAVGPEGGWTDEEVALLEEKGFSRYSLGPRILRTDTAVVALFARLQSV
ncbi:MAG: 16S rRNA (uracil(1498)-N(3))-methyltransferase [Kiritimatiellae bacterium]|nr:16S rRNA (uracil(1498)-N(3))-methyltransferase [Kiritimatiellia bacterium]